MKKTLFSAALLCGLINASFAKSEVKSDAKSNDDVVTTYYVTGQSGSNYLISTNPADDAHCTNTGTIPCRFTSPEPSLGSSIPKSTVDGELDDINIEKTRQSF